jgi:hypothetical protein
MARSITNTPVVNREVRVLMGSSNPWLTGCVGFCKRTYVALAGPSSSREPVLLPPPGISNGQVLGSRFLTCESDSEEAALQQLRMRQLSMRAWVAGHLAKAPQQMQQRADRHGRTHPGQHQLTALLLVLLVLPAPSWCRPQHNTAKG